MSSKVTVTYNGNIIVPEYEDTNTTVPVSYNGNTIANIETGSSKTLNCGGKFMRSNLAIGNKTLLCSGKIMNGDVGIDVISAGTVLGDIGISNTITLNESGSPVEFYVVKHDYESDLNGTGRTLVVRKNCYDQRAWNSSRNTYANSSIDTWLNGTYKNLLDSDVQEVMGTTTFEYTPGNGDTTVTTLSRSVFLLSFLELGVAMSSDFYDPTSSSYVANKEGERLASYLVKAYYNGTLVTQWTRSPLPSSTSKAVYVYGQNNGTEFDSATVSTQYYSRPAFTLPSTFVIPE